MSGLPAVFRVTYAQYGELRDDIAQQMARGGLLVKVQDTPGLDFDSSVALQLVLPDGTTLQGHGKVLQIFAGFGVAVTVEDDLVEQVSRLASRPEVASTGVTRHERVEPPPRKPSATQPLPIVARPPRSRPDITPPPFAPSTRPPASTPPATTIAPPPARARPASSPPPLAPPPARARPASSPPPLAPPGPAAPPAPSAPPAPASSSSAPARPDGLSRMEKIQKALHGTRDERNAILRDRDRTLHPFVLKNPQLDADDVVAIAKNPQMTSDLLKQIGERKEWFQRPAVALALARNPRTPPELAVRALDHVALEALRQIAKGTGVLPHVTQAARKKLLG